MMHLSQTNTKDFDVLVFNNRNQAYGAFVLRKSYSSTMLKSLLIGIAFVASLLAIPYLNKLFTKETVVSNYTNDGGYTLKELPVDKPEDKPEIPETRTAAAPPVETITFHDFLITDEPVNEQLVTLEDMEGIQPGLNTQDGDPNAWGMPETCVECEQVIGEDDKKKTYDWVELQRKPKFPGGDEAMWTYLGNSLVYPDYARQIGLEGKVYVTFVIDEWGNVTKVAVPREVGGGLDEEAARVVREMPRWEPGMQGGHPVRVSYQLPITFKLNN